MVSVSRLLADTGQYRLLFFAQDAPQRCANVVTAHIDPAQCRQLQQWVVMAQMAPNTSQFGLSRSQLKNELERLKPQIIAKIESLYNIGSTDL
ncbi:hypothetical protein H6G89_23565 [Oscillatoria sp. FACHB-1407]|uniref:hypothetical protein n=1 Tax=Oscillatoria sp. FACHB-1407 TaxID=2692847 RepID=UPI0016863EBD|nr:hypothetical protein [Oscillatoria sp. FACHB-1407]MBD2463985.1 hypothetical protein [Oscillatoria sp. FACHB-1407]